MVIRFLRPIFLFVGIWLLILALPQRAPWNPTNIETSGEIYHDVAIKIPIISHTISTSGIYIFIFIFCAIALLMGISTTARWNVARFVRSPKQLLSLLIPLFIFLFTLYPTKNGLPIVLYLMLSGLGLLFVIFGIYPTLIRLRGLLRINIWKPVTNAFYGMRSRYFILLVFFITFILTNICSYFIFERVPHVQDNIDQLFHAKIFLKGHLTVPSHEHKEFFDFTHNINNGRWYSEYPPGHTFMLMLGLLIGAPWIINPLLGSASVVLLYFIGKELFDEKTGRLAALLGILSPFIIIMSSGFFSHVTALFFTALFTLFFAKTVKKGGYYYPLIAGLSLGICLNARILTAVGMGLPYAFYAVYLMFRNRRRYIARFIIMLLGFLIMVGVLGCFNYLTNGDPLLTGYEVLWGKDHNPGFGHSGWGAPHTPKKGLIQNLNNLNALSKYLFEWCIPCTFFVMLFFAGGRRTKWDYLLIGSAFSLSFVHFFYWYQGWCFGPRFMYESTCPLILLTARGILHTPDIMKEKFQAASSRGEIRYVSALIVGFCILVAVSINVPVLVRLYSNDYWSVNTKVQKAVKREKISNVVVFVSSYYGSVLPLNSPLLDSEIIYARDLNRKNRLMMEYYPERRHYLAFGDEIYEIFSFFYDDAGELIIINSDFEKGDLDGWSVDGNAWGITNRDRGNRDGKFHAESLNGGEEATGILRSSNFEITGHKIKFLINGWNRDPLRPNQCYLKDAETDEILRTALPPNQDSFITRFWDVSNLIGRDVYMVIVDSDDETLKKGGFAWIGIDAVRQLP